MVDVDELLDIFEEIRPFEAREETPREGSKESSSKIAESFRIRYYSANNFIEYLKLFREFSDEVTFEVSKDGLRTQFMDYGRITLIKFRLDSYAFEELDVPDEPVRFTINVKSLLKSLPSKIPKRSSIVIEGYENALKLAIYGSYGELIAEVELPMLEGENWISGIKRSWEIEATARLNAESLYQAVKAVKGEWNRVVLKACDEELSFEKVDEEGKAKVVFSREDARLYELEVKKDARVLLDSRYLEKLLKHAKKFADEVNLKIASKKPIIVVIWLQDGELEYYQAPMIDE